jgi:hypothetical protein
MIMFEHGHIFGSKGKVETVSFSLDHVELGASLDFCSLQTPMQWLLQKAFRR